MWPCCGRAGRLGELAEADHGALAVLVSLGLSQEEGKVQWNATECCWELHVVVV